MANKAFSDASVLLEATLDESGSTSTNERPTMQSERRGRSLHNESMKPTEAGQDDLTIVPGAEALLPTQAAVAAEISIVPGDVLQFNLESPPKMAVVQLKLIHPGPGTKMPAAYKIKTTAPKRYLVRPNQGLLAPGGVVTVDIILVDRDHIALRGDRAKCEDAEKSDKFLVQTTPVQSAVLQGWEDRTQEQKQEQILSIWSSVDKKAVTGRRLKVRFQRPASTNEEPINTGSPPPPPLSSALQFQSARQNVKAQVSSGASAPKTDSSETVYSSVAVLEKKYNDLVTYIVNLTAERDMLSNELGEVKRDLQREVIMKRSLENQAGGEGVRQRKKTTIGTEKTQEKSSSKETGARFSMFSVLIVSLACFLLGRYLGMK